MPACLNDLFSLTLTILIAAPAFATDLGPTTRSDIGSDPGTLNTLQPATPTTLQSGTPQGSLNGTTSGAQLQPAGSRSDLPTSFSSDISGSPQITTKPTNSRTNQIILGLIGTFIAICAFFMFRISKQLEAQTEATQADNLTNNDESDDSDKENVPEEGSDAETVMNEDAANDESGQDQEPTDQPVESEEMVAADAATIPKTKPVKSHKKARQSRNHR